MMILGDFRLLYKCKVISNSKYSGLFSLIRVLFDINFTIVVIFRISAFFRRINLFFVAKIFWLINKIVFSVDIDPRAEFKEGLRLVHGQNIVVGHEVRCFGNITIYQNSTLGGNSGKRKDLCGKNTGQPVFMGNNTVGIGACVLGPVLVPEGVYLGTYAIVTKDVPVCKYVIGANRYVYEK